MTVPRLPKLGRPPVPAPLRKIAVIASTYSDCGASIRASLNQNLPGESYGMQKDLIWAVRGARCLLIVGLCVFVTGVVNAQTPDPSPVDPPQPGVRPALGPRDSGWAFDAAHWRTQITQSSSTNKELYS